MTAHVSGSAAARTRDRILQAALEWAEETGMRKLSMDEIASRARLGRATLYIHFPGRQALIDAAVRAELDRFFDEMATYSARYDDPVDGLVYTFGYAYRKLRDHRLLGAVMQMNPQILLPYVIRDATAIDIGREHVLASLAAASIDPNRREAQELAELIVRSFHSFILAPSKVIALDENAGAEEYARRYLAPVLRHLLDSAPAT